MVDFYFDLHKNAGGFLFDGFPRTVAQARALDRLLDLKKTSIAVVLALEVGEDELVKRLLNRGKTSGRTDDSDESIIRKRFSVYTTETSPVAEHYRRGKKFHSVKGEGSIGEIFEGLCKIIDNKMNKEVHP
jgi:adenylate kinase